MELISPPGSHAARSACVLWRRIVDDGSDEFCVLSEAGDGPQLEGTLVGLSSGMEPFACSYRIAAEPGLEAARHASILHRGPDEDRYLRIWRTSHGWTVEGSSALIEADEIDLEWSPVTNLFPIRRMIAQSKTDLTITAAWVRAEDLRIERTVQRYERVDGLTARYTNIDSGFTALIHHDGHGFPLEYQGVWKQRAFWSTP